jgi:2-oxoglutarate ferredoxin oxidoreductase subunit gamma
MLDEKVICAGFGGQGVMTLGSLLAYAGMIENLYVSWVPSYGPEMRGGTANCHVMVSENPIGSPIITDDATALLVMNLPSLIKFEKDLVPGGRLIINSSLIDKKPERDDIQAFFIPANDIALEIGNPKIANMVMLGSYIELSNAVKLKSIIDSLKKVFGPSKAHLLPMNEQALKRGGEAIKQPV